MNRMLMGGIALFSVALSAYGASAEQQLRAFVTDLQRFDARFVQIVSDADQRELEQTPGRVRAQLPDLFRWDYFEPYPQMILADGERVWIYDPDLDQVMVKKQALAEPPAIVSAFTNVDDLARHFRVVELGESEGKSWLELTPKNTDDGIEHLRMGLANGALVEIDWVDRFGQTTRLEFSSFERPQVIAAEVFKFTPPEGVDIIDDTLTFGE